MKHRPVHVLEYVLFRSVAALARVLPLRAALGLAWVAAAGMHFAGRLHVERTRRRIREVLGAGCPEREVRRIAWVSWRNLCFNAVEALRFSRLTLEKIRRQPLAAIEPQLRRILSEHETGFILATPHMGNWELAGVAADLAGIPIFVIVRKQKNPLLNAYLNKMRRSFGLELLYREARMWKSLVGRLKQGKVLAILPDIGVRAGGVAVDYLNGTANVAPGAALFARLAGCPVYPLAVRRTGWTKHDAVLLDPVEPDPALGKDEDLRRMMQEIMAALSKEILKTPEQYFWYNKRWVLGPAR